MSNKKTQKKYIDESLGFPVLILNAPLLKTRGTWTLNINYNKYQQAVVTLLAYKPSKLTGHEQQFIRKYFQMTIRSFAERFSVKHPAVVKWEKKANGATAMAWTTEKDIRLFIIDQLIKKSNELQKLYRVLNEEVGISEKPIQIDSDKIAA
jgi:DNA-binding transcriptional regulator YiaG